MQRTAMCSRHRQGPVTKLGAVHCCYRPRANCPCSRHYAADSWRQRSCCHVPPRANRPPCCGAGAASPGLWPWRAADPCHCTPRAVGPCPRVSCTGLSCAAAASGFSNGSSLPSCLCRRHCHRPSIRGARQFVGGHGVPSSRACIRRLPSDATSIRTKKCKDFATSPMKVPVPNATSNPLKELHRTGQLWSISSPQEVDNGHANAELVTNAMQNAQIVRAELHSVSFEAEVGARFSIILQ
mmetsp:Transcript_37333/g.74023  ORF Transcript_37333/g.74023 Transcript_37333/m.74023 type:complete len:240 (+) Transcript_37333:419-1138(+)